MRPFVMSARLRPDCVNPTSTAPLIELRNVSCGYGDRVILDGVNLRLERGKVLALIGTSGGGKTTVRPRWSVRRHRRWRRAAGLRTP